MSQLNAARAHAVNDLAEATGKRMARYVFAQRGDHAEVHLREPELAVIVGAAVEAVLLEIYEKQDALDARAATSQQEPREGSGS